MSWNALRRGRAVSERRAIARFEGFVTILRVGFAGLVHMSADACWNAQGGDRETKLIKCGNRRLDEERIATNGSRYQPCRASAWKPQAR